MCKTPQSLQPAIPAMESPQKPCKIAYKYLYVLIYPVGLEGRLLRGNQRPIAGSLSVASALYKLCRAQSRIRLVYVRVRHQAERRGHTRHSAFPNAFRLVELSSAQGMMYSHVLGFPKPKPSTSQLTYKEVKGGLHPAGNTG